MIVAKKHFFILLTPFVKCWFILALPNVSPHHAVGFGATKNSSDTLRLSNRTKNHWASTLIHFKWGCVVVRCVGRSATLSCMAEVQPIWAKVLMNNLKNDSFRIWNPL